MVRPQRVEYDGAYYHVMNRGRRRQKIFHADAYYKVFLSCLEQAHKRFALEVHAYCLMGNHYHLLVRTPRGNLSRAMRHVNGVYTQHYNSLKGTDGTLFKGRYKAINVEASSYLLEVSRYIHRSPVETHKPVAESPEDYRWSSYRSYRNLSDAPEWLYKESIFEELSSDQPTVAYERFVESGNDEDTEKFYAKGHWPAVRGSKKYSEKALIRSNAKKQGVCYERNIVDAEIIIKTVIRRFLCRREDLLMVKRGKGADNTARALAMKLCQEHGSMELSEIGKIFEMGSDSGVTKTISRLNQRLEDDRKLLDSYNMLCRDLTP